MKKLADLKYGLKIIRNIKRGDLTSYIRYLRSDLSIGWKKSFISWLLVCTEDVETIIYGRYVGDVEIYVFHLILQDYSLKIAKGDIEDIQLEDRLWKLIYKVEGDLWYSNLYPQPRLL